MAVCGPDRAGTRSSACRAADRGVPARQVTVLPGGIVMPGWYDRARCAGVGTDPFYSCDPGITAAAKSICQQCDVQSQCLDDALRRDEPHGIWGGLDEHERRALRGSETSTEGVLAAAPERPPGAAGQQRPTRGSYGGR